GPIARTGVLTWTFESASADRIDEAFTRSPKTRMRRDDFALGYFANRTAEACDHLNRANDYREWTPEMAGLVDGLLAHDLGERIGDALGHPYRVVSARSFDLIPGTGIAGRHLDGWPLSLRKLFILPHGASKRTGPGSVGVTGRSARSRPRAPSSFCSKI